METTKKPAGILAGLLVAITLLSTVLSAQIGYQFGQNKVHYKDFEWAVFRTDHFDVHYYPEEESAARNAALMAERGYEYLSSVLDHQIKERIPLILYASLNDFSQTNVVGGLLNQGTRGVTESLKNRVALPMTGSYREFHHVLVHELVHAFQFDMMFRSDWGNRRFQPPLWFVEGMAEYLSNGMDNITRMWVREGIRNKDLLTVSELNRTLDIRVYRLGQSLWAYVGETYGREMVATLFKSAVATGSVETALKEHLGKTEAELTDDWHRYATAQSMPADSTLPYASQAAEQLTARDSYYHRMNIVPSVSPDGRHVAYIANKNLSEEIYLMSIDKTGIVEDRLLLSGGTSKRFETLRFFDTGIDWRPDGQQIAFVSRSGGDDVLYLLDPHAAEVQRTFSFEDLNGLLSPTYSPDGSEIVFAGIAGGISDLYRLELKSGERTRLTNTPHATLHPQWSPDGSRIAFATDRGRGTDLDRLLFGEYVLALYHMETGTVELLNTPAGNAVNPQWAPDGRAIMFLSDQSGIQNIYRLDLNTGRTTAISMLADGVSGITATTPAFSWSASGEVLVFSAFQKDGWHLFRITPEEGNASAVLADAGTTDGSPAHGGALPEIEDPVSLYAPYPLISPDSVENREYSSRFKLDGISMAAGYHSFWGGVGAAQFLFSDMLGNHNLFFNTELQFSDPRHSDFGLTYLNLGNRMNYGLQLFQSSYSYTAYYTLTSVGFVRNTFRGFNGLAAYPFSRFMRAELTAGLTWVDQDIVEDRFTIGGIERESGDLGNFNYGQIGGALVYDNTTFSLMGPAMGVRSRISVQTTTNDFQFTNLVANFRSYWNVNHRSVLAMRLMSGSSEGRDQQIFSIGGPYTYRGADYGELLGPRFVLGNLEYRFPLLPFMSPAWDRLSGAAFVDAAAAWGIDAPGYAGESFQPFSSNNGFRLNDLNAALGIGARINLGYFLLQYDVAWPTDLQDVGRPIGRFSIGTFF